MRQWRVGTFSMGVLLIVFGVVLLVAQFKNLLILEAVRTWWPVILILLGVEILAYIYFSKEEQPKIKYDVLSILLVIFLSFTAMGLYALTATGLLPRLNQMVVSSNYAVQLPEERIELGPEIKHLNVMGPRGRLKVLAGNTREVVAFGEADIVAPSEEEADQLAARKFCTSRIVGETLFIEFRDLLRRGDLNPGIISAGYTLVIPQELAVEIRHPNYNQLEIYPENIENNWIIDAVGPVKVTGSAKANLEISAATRFSDYLAGNVEWQVSDSAGQNTDQATEYDGPAQRVRGVVKWGEGKYRLSISCEEKITVNQLD